jgi:hypothetical protein
MVVLVGILGERMAGLTALSVFYREPNPSGTPRSSSEMFGLFCGLEKSRIPTGWRRIIVAATRSIWDG